MNWHKEGIGAAIAEAKSKGEIFAVFVKSNSNKKTQTVLGLTSIAGPPEAAQEETQVLEAALLDEEVGLFSTLIEIFLSWPQK